MRSELSLLKAPRIWFYILALIALLGGLGLTLISHFEFCTSACAAAQKWRFFGYKFEWVGIAFFPTVILLHLIGAKVRFCLILAGLMIAACFGSELWFLYIQKYVIRAWCPVCVSLATCVFVAALSYVALIFLDGLATVTLGGIMKNITKLIPSLGVALIGFMVAFLGVYKIDLLQAEQATLKDNLAFGKQNSPIEVYIFTDWFCPACREAEPEIEKMFPEIEKQAKVFFVDAGIHRESLNFTPYNLSFMINNKDKYLALRKGLEDLAEKTKSPTENEIQEITKANGTELKELSFSDIALGVKLFKKLSRQFSVNATPEIIVINTETKKGKRIAGQDDITEKNVLKAIDMLQ